jgi:hypothetical protein
MRPAPRHGNPEALKHPRRLDANLKTRPKLEQYKYPSFFSFRDRLFRLASIKEPLSPRSKIY